MFNAEVEERPAKRRKTKNMPTIEEHVDAQAGYEGFDYDGINMGMDVDMDGGMQGLHIRSHFIHDILAQGAIFRGLPS